MYIDKKNGKITTKGIIPLKFFSKKKNQFKQLPPEAIKHEITISFVGDVCPWGMKVKKGYDLNYHSYFSHISKYIQSSNIAFCNLELPIAGGCDLSYSLPALNGSFRLLEALKATGWNVYNTANNHTLDQGGLGIDLTIEALEKLGLHFVGTGRKNAKEYDIRIVEVGGISIAFMSYTDFLNVDFLDFLLQGRKISRIDIANSSVNLEDIDRIGAKIRKLKQEGIDLVVMFFHIHAERPHKRQPAAFKREVMKLFCKAGADIIVSSGPHCLQPFEKITTYPDEIAPNYISEHKREHFIAYSLGDLITYDRPDEPGLILFTKIVKTSMGTFIQKIEYLPLYTYRIEETIRTGKGEKTCNSLRIYPLEELIFLLQRAQTVKGVKRGGKEEILRLKELYKHSISLFGKDNLMKIQNGDVSCADSDRLAPVLPKRRIGEGLRGKKEDKRFANIFNYMFIVKLKSKRHQAFLDFIKRECLPFIKKSYSIRQFKLFIGEQGFAASISSRRKGMLKPDFIISFQLKRVSFLEEFMNQIRKFKEKIALFANDSRDLPLDFIHTVDINFEYFDEIITLEAVDFSK